MESARKVLFTFVTMGPGGIERGVANLLQKLDRQRFPSQIFLHQRPANDLTDRIPADVPVTWGSANARYSRWMLPVLLLRLLRKARSCDVIVAAEEGRATLLAWLAGMLLRKPVIGMINFDWQAFGRTTRRRQSWGLRMIYPRLSMTVVCGEGARRAFEQIAPVAAERICVIRYVLPMAHVQALAQEPLPAWAEPVFQQPTIVACGRLEPQKDFPTLIRAHARLRTGGSKHHLLILGNGSQLGALQQLAAELGVAASVFLPGHAGNPFQFMRRATVFAMSSVFEGYGLALAEAMACGVPLVSTDCPSGPAEILDNGKYGTLVPPGDDGALATALGNVLTDPDHRADLVRRAEDGRKSFDPEQAVAAWQRLFAEVGRARTRDASTAG